MTNGTKSIFQGKPKDITQQLKLQNQFAQAPAASKGKTLFSIGQSSQDIDPFVVKTMNDETNIDINRSHFDQQFTVSPQRTSMLINGTQNVYSTLLRNHAARTGRSSIPVMAVMEKEKTETKEKPKFKSAKVSPYFEITDFFKKAGKYYEGTFDTPSGKKWTSK